MIEQVTIKNYKSIRELTLSLNRLNVLIGSNGVGKSNFISFFELTKAIFEQRFGSYTLSKGGIDNLLYHGRKVSEEIRGLIDFDNKYAFYFQLKPTPSSKGFIEKTGEYFNFSNWQGKDYSKWIETPLDYAVEESDFINSKKWNVSSLQKYLNSFTVYHFHDTSTTSPMRGANNLDDNQYLRGNGSNLAAYLYRLEQTDEKAFRLIEGVVRSIAPYFKRFNLKPNTITPNKISLEWEEMDSDMYLNGYSFSDGTLRFIALATLLLQSDLPEVIIIDEPELGLHPAAVNKFSALVKKASLKSQIIISTQSTNLVNCFEVNDIIVVDREDYQSVFKHLSSENLPVWINDYGLSLGLTN